MRLHGQRCSIPLTLRCQAWQAAMCDDADIILQQEFLIMVTSRLFSQNENPKNTSSVLFKSFEDTETFRNQEKKTKSISNGQSTGFCIPILTYSWLVVWKMFYIFPLILGIVIPIDVHIFQRG